MNKPSLLIAAAAVAFAGAASAATFDAPVHQAGEASTMTQGAPNLVTNNMPQTWQAPVYDSVDTTVLGASSGMPSYNVQDSHRHDFQGSAANTTPVPDRAGEASTLSSGAPNLQP